jgi:hypothetical protein
MLGMEFGRMDELGPIILIGAARSGTKFLRDVLKTAKGHAAVPYDVNYVWRYGFEDAPDDVLNPSLLTKKQIQFIRSSLRSLAKADREDVLIEKTVSNTLRVPFVEKVFPNARYVHLIRDGRDVTESAMRLWQAPPDWKMLFRKLLGIPFSNLGYVFWFAGNFLKGLRSGQQGGQIWGPRFKGAREAVDSMALSEVCATQWLKSVEMATLDLADIPAERVFEIRYEDLVKDETALIKLLGELQIDDSKTVLGTLIEKRKRRTGRWADVPKETKDKILAVINSTLNDKGYS